MTLALVHDDYDEVPVHPALCLPAPTWEVAGEHLHVGDTLVASPAALVALINQPGPLSPTLTTMVGGLLARAFPAAG